MDKYLYCPKCEKYPDKVHEISTVKIEREWNEDCYEQKSEEVLEFLGWECNNCGNKLINEEA